MTEAVQVAEILTDWNDRLVGLADALTKAAIDHGPMVADTVLAVARVTAAGKILFGAGCLVAALVIGRFAARKFNRGLVISKEKPRDMEAGAGHFALGAASGLVSMACGIVGVIYVCNIWNWAGVIEPKLWLAHKLLGL